MQCFNDYKSKNCKPQIQHQCSVISFFETFYFLCAKILGYIRWDCISNGYKNQWKNIFYPHRCRITGECLCTEWLLYRRIRLKKIKSENTPEIPCAMRVARAAPNTPRPSPATIQRSINIFKTEENIKRPSGIFDSPIDVNIVERILYINKNGKPTK